MEDGDGYIGIMGGLGGGNMFRQSHPGGRVGVVLKQGGIEIIGVGCR